MTPETSAAWTASVYSGDGHETGVGRLPWDPGLMLRSATATSALRSVPYWVGRETDEDEVRRVPVPSALFPNHLDRCPACRVPGTKTSGTVERSALRRGAPARGHYHVLHLIGRHPLLTIRPLSDLLGTINARIRHPEQDLVEHGWLRRIGAQEVPDRASVVVPGDWDSPGLVEITHSGWLRLAAFPGWSR